MTEPITQGAGSGGHVECLLDGRNTLGEGPVWDPERSCLFWTDIRAGNYFSLAPGSEPKASARVHPVGVMVGAIGLRAGAGLLLATSEGFAFHDPAGRERPTFIADPEAHLPDTRMNDGAVDPSGRFWAGSMGEGGGSLYRLDPDLSLRMVDEGFGTPNGIGWSPDGTVMYFTDSDARTIYRYDVDPAGGGIENRRPFVVSSDDDGVPDGLTVDAEGFVWSARWDGWRLERYDPEGSLERVVMMPVQRPTSVAFGGDDLDQLYVTSARIGLTDGELKSQPQAGGLFRLRPGVRGRAEYRFGG